MTSAHLLCPTAAERKALARALRIDRRRIEVCGIGPRGVAAWAARRAHAIPSGSIVMVAGTCGGLVPHRRVGQACWVGRVRYGARNVDTVDAGGLGKGHVVVSVDAPASGLAAKRALAEASGAELVDMESGPFAALAQQHGWKLRIARAVSDACDEDLPDWLMDAVNLDGSTRPLGVLKALTRLPRTAREILFLRRRLAESMAALATLLREESLP